MYILEHIYNPDFITADSIMFKRVRKPYRLSGTVGVNREME